MQRRTGTGLGLGGWKATCLLALLQLGPMLLPAQQPAIRQLFPAKPDSFLTDVAGVVDPQSAGEINGWAARLRKATGAELAVVTLPTIKDFAPGDVALNIGRAWGVGAAGAIGDSARNAGVVLLLVPRTPEHKGEIYLSTGRGVEGVITDAIAGRITDLMIPELQRGRYGPALVLGTRAVAATVAKGFGVSDSALAATDPFRPTGGRSGVSINPQLILLIIFVIVIILSAISRGGGGGGRRRRGRRGGPGIFWGGGGGWGSGGWGGGSGGGSFGGGGGFGGFGGGGGFSGGGAGRSF